MVTSRRQIDREEDRYGGYDQETAINRSADTGRRNMSENVRRAQQAHVAGEGTQTIETIRRPGTTMRSSRSTARGYDRTIAPERPSRYSEVMPEVRRREEPVAIVKEQRLTAGTKRMLIIYLSLVLCVVTAIIVTGVIASNIRTDIGALEAEVNSQMTELADITTGMNAAYDAALVWAGENMVQAGTGNTYEELIPGNSSENSGEVFDSIRDWVNSVFGG